MAGDSRSVRRRATVYDINAIRPAREVGQQVSSTGALMSANSALVAHACCALATVQRMIVRLYIKGCRLLPPFEATAAMSDNNDTLCGPQLRA